MSDRLTAFILGVFGVGAAWLTVTTPFGAMPLQGRSAVLRTEPVPVSSLRAPATIAKGESHHAN